MSPWYDQPDILRELDGIDERLRFALILGARTRRGFSEAWRTVSLGAGWANYTGTSGLPAAPSGANNPAGYYKDANGFVYLRGAVVSTAGMDATIFQLPAGYLPTNREVFVVYAAVASSPTNTRVDVLTTGEIQVQEPGPFDWLMLDNHAFRSYVPGAG